MHSYSTHKKPSYPGHGDASMVVVTKNIYDFESPVEAPSTPIPASIFIFLSFHLPPVI